MRLSRGQLRRLIESVYIENEYCENDMCEDETCEMHEMHDDDDLDEVTPPGYEKIVRGLKKNPGVDNPWAVANSMKKKGIGPKK